VLSESCAHFVGKVSPLHFFWSSMDLVCARAFPDDCGCPSRGRFENCGDWVMVEGHRFRSH
jgi:hypothetical protein